MELRVLQYFLAVTREQSISGAAEALHLSQPTLSRQLKEMEEELGKQLLIRGNRRVTLTEEGMILRKRAEEIMELVHKAESEIALADDAIAGDVTIGAAESESVRFLVQTAKALREPYPSIHLHIISGDKISVLESLDRGLIDFGLISGVFDASKYDSLAVPMQDHIGVLMRRDAPLARKAAITREDLLPLPLIVSRQMLLDQSMAEVFGPDASKLNIVGSYNLLYNGSLMVDEGLGYALCYDNIINVSGNCNLCFRPLCPDIQQEMHVVWKKYQVLARAAEKFLLAMQDTMVFPPAPVPPKAHPASLCDSWRKTQLQMQLEGKGPVHCP